MGAKQKKKDSGGGFLAQGAILAAAGIIVKLISLFYRIPVTNILGDEGQGYYSTAFAVYALALMLTSYSMPLAVSKLVSARLAKKQKRNAWKLFKAAFLLSACVGGIIAIVFFFGADFIADNILKSPLSAYPLRFLAPGLFVVSIIAVLRGYFQGLGNMIPTAVSQIIEQVVNALAAIWGAIAFLDLGKELAKSNGIKNFDAAYGAAGATLGPVLGATAALFFLGFLLYCYRGVIRRQIKRDVTKRDETTGQLIKIILITCAPVLLSTTMYNISESLDMALFYNIMNVQGHAYSEYTQLWGMFSGKYNTWINVPLAMANALGVSMMPSLTAAVTTKDQRMIHKKIYLVIRFSMLIAIPCFVGLAIMAKPILTMFYSGNIEIPSRLMNLGAISVVFFCLSTVTNAVLQGINRMTTPVKNAAVALIIHLISVFVMLVMFKWNIYSIIVGNIIFSLCMCILNQKSIRRAIGYRQEIKRTFVIPLIAAGVMGIITFAVYTLLDIFAGGTLATVIALLVAVLVYAAALLLLGGLTEEEILSMPIGAALARIFDKLHLLQAEKE